MQDRLRHSQQVAAARAGFSERTGRRIDADPRLPSQRKPERGRTVPIRSPRCGRRCCCRSSSATPPCELTLLRHLQIADPMPSSTTASAGRWSGGLRDWRALHGPARDVIFRQTSEPGSLESPGGFDLDVTIAGAPFPHRLYHFVLAYSGWSTPPSSSAARLHRTGRERQNALWALGGVPDEHRSDSLSAAYRNLDAEAAKDVTRRYDEFCAHYGMAASRCNPA